MKRCSEKIEAIISFFKNMMSRIKITTIIQRLDSRIVRDKDYFGDWEDKTEKLFQGTV